MVASIVIDHLWDTIRDEKVGIAYIYFNYRRQLEQTSVNLLGSLLKQLLQERPSISNDLRSLYEHHTCKKTRPTFDEILKVLHTEMTDYSRIFIVVDALDECPDGDGIRQLLLANLYALQATTAMNLMVTSRFIPKITQEFRKAIWLEIRACDEDVKRYLEGQMSRLSSCVMRSTSLQEVIKCNIIKAVDGMYVLPKIKSGNTNL